MDRKFHRCAVLVAISALVLIVIGAYITSQATGRQPASRGILDGVLHKDVAIAVGISVLAFAYWQFHQQQGSLLLWAALGLFALEASSGWLGGPLVLHACLAPVAFSTLVALAAVSSSGWNQKLEPVEDRAAPTLRILAFGTPLLLLLQIMLGAAYRHKLIGVLPHLCGAMILAIPILAFAMLILQRHPEHQKLHAAATWLICIFMAQVLLGFTALTVPVLKLSAIAVIVATTAHVVLGSVTLAANLLLTMQVVRSVYRAPDGTALGSRAALECDVQSTR